MFDLTSLTPYAVTLVVFGVLAAVLAVATIARLALEARTPRRQPVVLVTTERGATRVAA